MKMISMGVILLISGVMAFGHIGETESELRTRFGKELGTSDILGDRELWFFKDPILICAVLLDSKCVAVQYVMVSTRTRELLAQGSMPEVIGWDTLLDSESILQSHTPGLWIDGRLRSDPEIFYKSAYDVAIGPPDGSRWAQDRRPLALLIWRGPAMNRMLREKRAPTASERWRSQKGLSGF